MSGNQHTGNPIRLIGLYDQIMKLSKEIEVFNTENNVSELHETVGVSNKR